MLLRAFAKINLDLRILGKRDDGYHELKTVFQAVDWFDEIHMEPAASFSFSAAGVPEDETNLVVRAVRAYEKLAGITANVDIRLIKNIPVGRGLGGGSADAAATFIGLQRMYKLPLAFDQVPRVLRDLGSDVPFFAIGGRAIGYGRGDELHKLDDATDYWVLVVDPGVFISTVDAYSWLTVPHRSNTIEGFGAVAEAACSDAVWTNDFEGPVFERYPELARIKEELLSLGAYRAALSGSGSAIFGQFQLVSEAVQAGSALGQRFRVKLAKPLPRWEYFQKMVED